VSSFGVLASFDTLRHCVSQLLRMLRLPSLRAWHAPDGARDEDCPCPCTPQGSSDPPAHVRSSQEFRCLAGSPGLHSSAGEFIPPRPFARQHTATVKRVGMFNRRPTSRPLALAQTLQYNSSPPDDQPGNELPAIWLGIGVGHAPFSPQPRMFVKATHNRSHQGDKSSTRG